MSSEESIPVRTKAGPSRASFAQERMWYLEALDPVSAMYNMVNGFRIRGAIDPGLIERSLTVIMGRHEALRTNLFVKDGLIYQGVAAPGPMHLTYVDLSDTRGDPVAAAEQLLSDMVKKPFDLSSEPLVRPYLLKLEPDDFLLALITHHSILDGWSMSLFPSEIAAVYESLVAGQDPARSLPPLPIQYADYSLWQRQKFDRGDYDGQLRYWLAQLDGELPILALPTDHPRPPVQSYKGKTVTIVLPPGLTAALKAVGRKEKATLNMTLLTAFNVFLYRYTGQDDLIVGCPIAGRNHYQKEGLLGMFVNTLPIRNQVLPGMSFLELLRQVRSTTLEAYDNQDLPFEKLVERLRVSRSLDTSPVFQVLFQLLNFPSSNAMIAGRPVEHYEFDDVMAKVDLTLELTPIDDGIACRFEYPVALFDRDTITRMAIHWRTLLEDIVNDPTKAISRLRIMPEDEFKAVLAMGKGDARAYPRDSTVDRVFEAQARKHSRTVAIRHGEKRVTYGQLDVCANGLADRLVSMNVKPGDTVALIMDRSAELVASMLAILKAGGAYLPVDPADADHRIQGILEDARVRVAMTSKEMAGRAQKLAPHLLIASEDDLIHTPSYSVRTPGVSGPESNAYVIFTSGSTGTPKGVCITHRGILRLVINTDYVQIKHGDIAGHTGSPAFDVSTFEIWGTLLNGATLDIFDKEVILSPLAMKKRLGEERHDVLFLTTPLFHVIATACPDAFSNVRDLIVGGDALEPGPSAAVLQNSPPGRLINGYGPTEVTTFSHWYHVRYVPPPGEPIPIGRPMANNYMYILDNELQPVPVGVKGELFVGGDGIATGYLGRPDLTARAFLPDPFNPGQRIYRTGDLARFLPDGIVQFLGRIDGQVKIHGFRVEAGEVAAALESHPSVRKAVIRAVTGQGGFKMLAAYMLKSDGASASANELREYLASRLPDYMIPSSLLWIDSVPLTPNGKINYRALPEPVIAIGPQDQRLAGSKEEISKDMKSMIELWEGVLCVKSIRPDDNFFDLGGHSLLAILLIGRIEEKFKKKLPMSAIMKAPTVRQMVRAIDDLKAGSISPTLVVLKAGGSKPPLFCFPLVWGKPDHYYNIVCQMDDDRPIYGLQSPGLDDATKIPDSIEALASDYVLEIRRCQPHGPYSIFGYCSAGPIAFESARQMEMAGEKVGFLGIVDYPAQHSNIDITTRFGKFRYYMENIAYSGAALLVDFLDANRGEKIKKIGELPRQLLKTIRKMPKEIGSSYPQLVMNAHESEREMVAKNNILLNRYTPKKYGGEVTLFLSTKTIKHYGILGYEKATLGWRKLASGGVDHYVIEGDHISIIKPENAKLIDDIIMKKMDNMVDRVENGSRKDGSS